MNYSRKHIIYLCQVARKNDFSFPQEMDNKSYAWIQRHYNGIGAEWMSRSIRNIATKFMQHMEPEAMLHDIEYLNKKKSYWNFTKANFRLCYNAFKARHLFSGIALALICQIFGWSAWKEGKENMSYYYYYKEGGK